MRKFFLPVGTSSVGIVAAFMVGALLLTPVAAAASPGMYLGASVGESWVDASVPSLGSSEFGTPEFRRDDTGYQVMLGVRPLPFLGAELDYLDLGHPHGGVDFTPVDVRMRGGAAFGMLYLPLPVPTVDVFGKVGIARLQTVVEGGSQFTCGFLCGPGLFRDDRDTTGLALGAGAQFSIGPFSIRTEYERFNAAGGNPSLATVDATWTFF
jgi:opacity protein-like surface antigen